MVSARGLVAWYDAYVCLCSAHALIELDRKRDWRNWYSLAGIADSRGVE